MFISKSEYEELKRKADANVKSEREEELESELKQLNKDFSAIVREGEIKDEDHKREIDNLTADNKVLLARKDAEIATKVANDTKKLTDEINTLTIQKNNAEQKATILETAFKNLGFDVKDMKGILDKLVEGLIAKNQIQLIHTNTK